MFRQRLMKLIAVFLAVFVLILFIWRSQILNQFPFADSVTTWQLPSTSEVIAISPNGEMIATAVSKFRELKSPAINLSKYSSTVEIRQVANGEIIRVFKFPSASKLAFSPDNKLIAAGSYGGRIKVWGIDDGYLLHSFISTEEADTEKVDTKIGFLSFAPDGQHLVSRTLSFPKYSNTEHIYSQKSYNTVSVWDLASDEISYTLKDQYSCIGITPDGQLALTIKNHNALILNRLSDGTPTRQLDLPIGSCFSLKFSANGKQVAFKSAKINIYNLEDLTHQHLLVTSTYINGIQVEYCRDFALSPDGQYIAAPYTALMTLGGFMTSGKLLSTHGRIRLWRLDEQPTLEPSFEGNRFESVWTMDDGRKMRIEKWLWTLKGHKLQTSALAFAPDGSFLVSVGQDDTVRFWRMPPRTYPWSWLFGSGKSASLIYKLRYNLENWLNL